MGENFLSWHKYENKGRRTLLHVIIKVQATTANRDYRFLRCLVLCCGQSQIVTQPSLPVEISVDKVTLLVHCIWLILSLYAEVYRTSNIESIKREKRKTVSAIFFMNQFIPRFYILNNI